MSIVDDPFKAIAMAAAISAATVALVYRFTRAEPVECLEAPEVVQGWHTVTGRPESGFVCGYHQAGVRIPVYRCVRMEPCR